MVSTVDYTQLSAGQDPEPLQAPAIAPESRFVTCPLTHLPSFRDILGVLPALILIWILRQSWVIRKLVLCSFRSHTPSILTSKTKRWVFRYASQIINKIILAWSGSNGKLWLNITFGQEDAASPICLGFGQLVSSPAVVPPWEEETGLFASPTPATSALWKFFTWLIRTQWWMYSVSYWRES